VSEFWSRPQSDADDPHCLFLLTGLLRFIQVRPFVARTGRKRRDYPAAIGGREAESREQAGELRRLGSRDSTGSKLRHNRDDDFHGPAVRISCGTRRNHLRELSPYSFLFVG
jgi:hypothetical protein